MLRGFTRRFPPINVLTEEQANTLHRAILDVLRETGVRFESEQALNDLAQIGCLIDREEKRARFPEYLVEEAIRRTPSSHRIRADG